LIYELRFCDIYKFSLKFFKTRLLKKTSLSSHLKSATDSWINKSDNFLNNKYDNFFTLESVAKNSKKSLLKKLEAKTKSQYF